MNKIVKQKQNICCEIGKEILNNYSAYEKELNKLIVEFMEEYFKKEVTPKMRALSWKNIHRVLLTIDDFGIVEHIWKNYDDRLRVGKDNYFAEYGIYSYKQYKACIDTIFRLMKQDIDNDEFELPFNSISKSKLKINDRENQMRAYRTFVIGFRLECSPEITIIKKSRHLKKEIRYIVLDLD